MKCVCASLRPGMTMRRPASITRVFGPLYLSSSPGLPTATMRSPRIAIASAFGCFGSSVAMRPLTIRVSAGSSVFRRPEHPPRAETPATARNSRREAIAYLLVLRLELEAGSVRLREQQGGEVLLGHPLPDHLLQEIARERSERYRHLEFAPRVEAEVEVLAQQLGREGDVKVEVHQRRGLVAGEHGAHHALVQEIEEGVARHADLLREDRDLAQRLDHHAEVHVVADLGDARKLALADVARADAHHVEVRLGLFICRFGPGHHEGELSRLDDFRIPTHGCGEVLHYLCDQHFEKL